MRPQQLLCRQAKQDVETGLTGDVLLPPDNPGGAALAGGDHLGLASGAPPPPLLVGDVEAVLGLGGRRRCRRRLLRLVLFGHGGSSPLLAAGPGSRVLLRLAPERRDVNGLLAVEVKVVVEAQRGVGLVARSHRRRSGPRGRAVAALGPGPGFGVLPGLLQRADIRAPPTFLLPGRGFGFATRLLTGRFAASALLGSPGGRGLWGGVADLLVLLRHSLHQFGVPANGTGRHMVQFAGQDFLLDAAGPPPLAAAPPVRQAPSHGDRGRQGDHVTGV